MKHQTLLPTPLPSKKSHTQEGKKNTHKLGSQVLVVILVLAVVLAAYTAVNVLRQNASPNRSTAILYPMVYDATGAMQKAILLPNQVDKTASRIMFYDATAMMIDAITPNDATSGKSVRSLYDATAAMQAAIAPRQATYSASIIYFYDATAAMQAAITPQKSQVIRPVYDATASMLKAIVWP